MRLLLRHPRIAEMNCELCQKYVVNHNTWTFEKGRDGKPELRLLNCGPSFLAPCRDPERGCPKGSPENPKSLTAENELCYEHYRECEAVGEFPDDSVVRRNAAVIRGVIESVTRLREVEFQTTLLRMIDNQCQPPSGMS